MYSPHTAVDAAPGGLGDWLADIVTGTLPEPEPSTHTAKEGKEKLPDLGEDEVRHKPVEDGVTDGAAVSGEKLAPKPKRPSMMPRSSTYSKPTYPKPAEADKTLAAKSSEIQHTRSTIHPIPGVAGFEGAGMGRFVQYQEAQPLTHLIERIAKGVGSPKGFPVAIPQNMQVEDIQIRSVGVCAGSGHSILKDCDADLLFTGELSHHDALRMTEQGKCVVTLFHSNSERGFLTSVMKDKLAGVLREEWEKVRNEVKEEIDGTMALREEWEDALKDEDVLVEVSEKDRDPFGIVILQSDQEGLPLS